MKHFEVLWEEAEREAEKHNLSLLDSAARLNNLISELISGELSEEAIGVVYGEIVMIICFLSSNLNINSYSELQKTIWHWQSSRIEKERKKAI